MCAAAPEVSAPPAGRPTHCTRPQGGHVNGRAGRLEPVNVDAGSRRPVDQTGS